MSGSLFVHVDDPSDIGVFEQLVINYELTSDEKEEEEKTITSKRSTRLDVGEKVLINCHSANTSAKVVSLDEEAHVVTVELLETPICAEPGVTRVSISKKQWGVFVVAHGQVIDGTETGH